MAAESPGSSYYNEMADNLNDQPDSLLPPATIVQNGATQWALTPSTDKVKEKYSLTVSFPETGEWLITGYWELDNKKIIANQLKFTIGEKKGTMGWQKDYSPVGTHYIPADELFPLSVKMEIARIPGVNQIVDLKCTCVSLNSDVPAAIDLRIYHMEGTEAVQIPLNEVIVEGDIGWRGIYEANKPIVKTFQLKFPQTGDWYMLAFPAGGGICSNMYFNVGKDTGRYGWLESHEAKPNK
ncbi:MAG: hypothetical protein PHE50_03430 [Dehalococcoidales bacterium]|nr:hypothetical protein [Dehalococcoidales bacterium]